MEEALQRMVIHKTPKDIMERIFLKQTSNLVTKPNVHCAVGFLITMEQKDAKIVVLPFEDISPLKINISEFVMCDVIEEYTRPQLFGKEMFMVKYNNEIHLSCGNAFENCCFLTENLHRLFPANIFGFKVDFNNLTPEKINQLLDFGLFRQMKELVIIGETVSTELVNRILDLVCPEILAVETPLELDFPHQRTFNLDTLIYEKAENLKIETLLGDFQCVKMYLKVTSFDCRDMNKFFSHLVNHGFRKLKIAEISMKKGLRFEKQQLFKGLATVRLADERHSYILSTEVCDGTPRQFKMGKLHFEPSTNTLTFTKWTDRRFASVKKIMILLRQKEDIKGQLVNNNRVMKNLQNIQIPGNNEHQNLDIAQSYHVVQNEQKMLVEQLDELVEEIERKQVYLCADGFYELTT